MGKKMESFIFVSLPIKGMFWHFQVDGPLYLTYTVSLKYYKQKVYEPIFKNLFLLDKQM